MTAPVPSQGGNPGPAHPAWLAMRDQRLAKRQRQLSRLARIDPAIIAAALQSLAKTEDELLADFRAELDDDLTVAAWFPTDPDDPDNEAEEEK